MIDQVALLIDNRTIDVIAVHVQTNVLHRVSSFVLGCLFFAYHNLMAEWDTRPFYFTSCFLIADFASLRIVFEMFENWRNHSRRM